VEDAVRAGAFPRATIPNDGMPSDGMPDDGTIEGEA
jgi:hypothetical protein